MTLDEVATDLTCLVRHSEEARCISRASLTRQMALDGLLDPVMGLVLSC